MKPGDLVRKLDEEVWRDWPGAYKGAGIPENTLGIIAHDYPPTGAFLDGVCQVVCVMWMGSGSLVKQEEVRAIFLEVVSEAG